MRVYRVNRLLIVRVFNMDKKKCSNCYIFKDIKYFWKNKYSKDGYCVSCKKCIRKAQENVDKRDVIYISSDDECLEKSSKRMRISNEDELTDIDSEFETQVQTKENTRSLAFNEFKKCAPIMKGKKRCSKCKQEKSREEFWKNSGTPDGLCFQCKTCKSSLMKKNREINKVRNMEEKDKTIDKKRCVKCKMLKDIKYFIRDNANKDGFSYRCKQCPYGHSNNIQK